MWRITATSRGISSCKADLERAVDPFDKGGPARRHFLSTGTTNRYWEPTLETVETHLYYPVERFVVNPIYVVEVLPEDGKRDGNGILVPGYSAGVPRSAISDARSGCSSANRRL